VAECTVQTITTTVARQASVITTMNESPVAGRLPRFAAGGNLAALSSA
jgi:hypothetical protein